MAFRTASTSRFAVLLLLVAASRSADAAFSPALSTAARSSAPGNSLPFVTPRKCESGGGRWLSSVVGMAGHPGGSAAMADAPPATGFIDTELRGAAMRLHTRKQAPKEGQAEEKAPRSAEPYVTKHEDYLAFLVDSQAVYQAFEDVVEQLPEMAPFRNTGLERTGPLEIDIEFMVKEYGLERPEVGPMGAGYAEEIRRIANEGTVPELMCHYYNHYFAHTAGGRMIGKRMAALLLNKKTLEFYKWDGDINEIKVRVKDDIEKMADSWTREEKDECVDATAATFRYGGGMNSLLSGGASPH